MKSVGFFILSLIVYTAVYSQTTGGIDCKQVNALDDGISCCWVPDPTGAHAYGHVLDVGKDTSRVTFDFQIMPGAGDAHCVTTAYMYHSLDGKNWKLFFTLPDAQGWTPYNRKATINEKFRYIRGNTDNCSVDWLWISISNALVYAAPAN